MNSISEGTKNLFNTSVRLLNQPIVKEGVKNIAGSITLVFGPNTIFAVNPWHPRHIVSLVAVILALPSLAQSAYKGINWTYKKVQQYQESSTHGLDAKAWLTDTKIRLMTLFNTITSRPVLHLGNQLGHFILRG